MSLKLIEYRQLIQIIIMFMIVQFFGLFLAVESFSGLTYQQVQSAQAVSSISSALFYFAYIVIVAVILLFIMKYYRGLMILKVLEGVTILIGAFYVFLIILSSVNISLFSGSLPLGIGMSIAAAAILVVAKNRFPQLKNFTTVLVSAGVGVVLGISFGFAMAFIFMALVAVYDFIAVFVTKHMITLGNYVMQNNLAFMIDTTEAVAVPKSSLNAEQLSLYNKNRKQIMASIPHGVQQKGMISLPSSSGLGAGDLAMPLMLEVSAFNVFSSFTFSIVIILGSILGILIAMFVLKKYHRALPAITFLLFGDCIAILIFFLAVGVVHL